MADLNELTSAAVYGLVIALAIDLGWFLLLLPEMPGNAWQCPTAFLACLIQTGTTTAGVAGLARLHRVFGINSWLAIRHGVIKRAIAGAASIGVGMLLGISLGRVVSPRESAYLNTDPAPTVFRHRFGAEC